MSIGDGDGFRDSERGRDRDRNGFSRATGDEGEEKAPGFWDRDGGRDRDGDSYRDRGKERENSRDIDRDRRGGNRAFGGDREQTSGSPVNRFRRINDDEGDNLRRRDIHDIERMPISRSRGREYDDDVRRPVSRDRGREYDDDARRPVGRDRDREYDDDERMPLGRGRGRGQGLGDDEQRSMGRDNRDREYYNDGERRPMGSDRVRGGRGRGGRGRGDDSGKPAAPPLYSIHRATVRSVRPFGIFVQMEGYRNDGLVHLSQVSDHEVTNRDDSEEAKVKALSSVADEGEQVWVKVVSVQVEEDRKTKIGCSMKYVNQGNGEDLDPNNIQAEKNQARPSWKEPQKFKLEAVYNVQCERCGGHGHLKKECYSSGEKSYKLLSDDEDTNLIVQNVTKGGDRFPAMSAKPPKPPSGISTHLLATGSVGRGRAVVQPAWMKHGIGVGGPAPPPVVEAEHKKDTTLPDIPTTVEEAYAVIARLKEEKQRRKEKRDKRHSSKDDKKDKREKKDKHRKRHRDSEDHKERHKSRRKRRDKYSEVETDSDDYKERKKHSHEDDYKKSKKHRDDEESDEDNRKERQKHRDDDDHKERKKHRHEDDYKKSRNHRDDEESDEDDRKERKKHRDEDDHKERNKHHDEDGYKKSDKYRDEEFDEENHRDISKHRDEDSQLHHGTRDKHRDMEDYEVPR